MNKNISIVGVGKLGLCLALNLEKKGFNVIGVDVSQDYIDSLNRKDLESDEESVSSMLRESKNIQFTTNLEESLQNDLIFLVVATPSLSDGNYDHRYIDGVVESYLDLGVPNKHLVICCTTMPGYCSSVAEKMDKLAWTVTYNPEFIAQGTIIKDQLNPDMVLIGQENEEKAFEVAEVYKAMVENSPRYSFMSRTEAEITKIALNCFLTTKIAYANMVGDVVLAVGGNPDKVLSAIGSDTRIGSKYLRYGFGFGGPCFPRDNKAFGNFAEFSGVEPHISRATDASNRHHLYQQIRNLGQIKEYTFDCVTYKPESTILTESQQLALALELVWNGVKVTIKERPSVIEQLKTKYGEIFTYEPRNN